METEKGTDFALFKKIRPARIVKHLRDFRSAISALPGSTTCRATDKIVKLQGSPAKKFVRNLLTTYETIDCLVLPLFFCNYF